MMNRIAIITVIFFCQIFFCCCGYSLTRNDEKTAGIGSYYSPEKIINTLENNASTSSEYYICAKAFAEKKQYKKALLFFANSAFLTHRDRNLRLFASPVYRFIKRFHRHSNLYNDAIYQIAQIFYLYSEYDYVLKFTDIIKTDSLALTLQAKILKSKTLQKMNRNRQALKCLKELKTNFSDTQANPLILIRMASIYESLEQYTDAKQNYMKIITDSPESWEAHSSAQRVLKLLSIKKITITGIDRMPLCRSLYSSGKYRDALEILTPLTQTSSSDLKGSTDLQELIIRLYSHEDKPSEIKKKVKLYAGNDRKRYADLLATAAQEYAKMSSTYRAFDLYKEIACGEESRVKSKALMYLINFYEERGNIKHLSLARDYLTNYTGKEGAELCKWFLVRHELKIQNKNRAIDQINSYLESFPQGPHSDRCRYWYYNLSGMENDIDKTIKYLARMIRLHPSSSYTWMIIDSLEKKICEKDLNLGFNKSSDPDLQMCYHLLLLAKNHDFKARNERLKKIKTVPTAPYKKYEELIQPRSSSLPDELCDTIKLYASIGDITSLEREISLYNEGIQKSIHLYGSLIFYGKKYALYHFTLVNSLKLMDSLDLDCNIAFAQRETIESLYPTPFKQCFKDQGGQEKIDPLYIYSVIKAESSFNHQATSPAGARGLMQFMTSTASDVARRLKIKDYELMDPCDSIRLGSFYLNWLIKYYSGDKNFAIAAYNAGMGNVNNWKKNPQFKTRAYFIEFIPFNETRSYILKINRFYSHYRILYEKYGN